MPPQQYSTLVHLREDVLGGDDVDQVQPVPARNLAVCVIRVLLVVDHAVQWPQRYPLPMRNRRTNMLPIKNSSTNHTLLVLLFSIVLFSTILPSLHHM